MNKTQKFMASLLSLTLVLSACGKENKDLAKNNEKTEKQIEESLDKKSKFKKKTKTLTDSAKKDKKENKKIDKKSDKDKKLAKNEKSDNKKDQANKTENKDSNKNQNKESDKKPNNKKNEDKKQNVTPNKKDNKNKNNEEKKDNKKPENKPVPNTEPETPEPTEPEEPVEPEIPQEEGLQAPMVYAGGYTEPNDGDYAYAFINSRLSSSQAVIDYYVQKQKDEMEKGMVYGPDGQPLTKPDTFETDPNLRPMTFEEVEEEDKRNVLDLIYAEVAPNSLIIGSDTYGVEPGGQDRINMKNKEWVNYSSQFNGINYKANWDGTNIYLAAHLSPYGKEIRNKSQFYFKDYNGVIVQYVLSYTSEPIALGTYATGDWKKMMRGTYGNDAIVFQTCEPSGSTMRYYVFLPSY